MGQDQNSTTCWSTISAGFIRRWNSIFAKHQQRIHAGGGIKNSKTTNKLGIGDSTPTSCNKVLGLEGKRVVSVSAGQYHAVCETGNIFDFYTDSR